MASFLHPLKKLLRYTLYALTIMLAVLFALSNRQRITLDFFPFGYEATLPLFLLIFLSVLLGILVGNLSALASRLSVFRSSRQAREKIAALENEVAVMTHAPSRVSTGKSLTHPEE